MWAIGRRGEGNPFMVCFDKKVVDVLLQNYDLWCRDLSGQQFWMDIQESEMELSNAARFIAGAAQSASKRPQAGG